MKNVTKKKSAKVTKLTKLKSQETNFLHQMFMLTLDCLRI